jgi:hypothetical protein
MDELAGNWDAACLRLEDYLRAHGVEPRERLLSLTLEMMHEAKRHHSQDPGKSALETTMDLAMAKTNAWFSALAGSPEKASRARVAFFSIPIQSKWASAFLSPSPHGELVAQIRAASHEAGPALDFQSLVRKEMNYGAMENIARETWDQFSWSHVLRAFVIWVVVFLAAYGIYLRFFA